MNEEKRDAEANPQNQEDPSESKAEEVSQSEDLSAMQHMARDLGFDPGSVSSFTLKDVLKQGPESTLFIARVSQVFFETSHLKQELKSLRDKLEAEEVRRKRAEARVVELERSKLILEKEAEYYSTTAQNSTLSTVLFALGSISIGAAGSCFAISKYTEGILASIFGVSLSVFAAFLIIRRRND